jgi:hypothetical protein
MMLTNDFSPGEIKMAYQKLTVIFPTRTDISNAVNYSGKKELIEAMSIVVSAPDKRLHEVCTARWWMGRSKEASVIYASLWVRRPRTVDKEGNLESNSCWWSGTGSAGGYGYHKVSAALDEAISSAGITLSRSVSGTGECEQALMAIAQAMFPRLKAQRFLVVSH